MDRPGPYPWMGDTDSWMPFVCKERGCTLGGSYDPARREMTFQHNRHPEHVLVIPDDMVTTACRPGHETYEPWVVRWCQAIHQYEDDPEAWIAAALTTQRGRQPSE